MPLHNESVGDSTYPQLSTAMQCDTTRNGYITVVATNWKYFVLKSKSYARNI